MQEGNAISVAIAKWTLDEYHRMIEVELLDDRHVELLNREIEECLLRH